jgi:hypothetical protein
MKLIIRENQYRKILLEYKNKDLINIFDQLKEFSDSVLSAAKKDMKINFRMLSTWGAAVGGVIQPLNDFIENGNFELNSFQVSLILVATASILFNESKNTIQKLLSLIKEENIESEFTQVLEKGNELKSVFVDFIDSLNITLYTITNIMSYAFIIPILPILWEMSQSGIDTKEINEILVRLVSFGSTSISGNLIKQLFNKVISRFRD